MPDFSMTVESWAASFGFACVALTIRQSILCWPTGLVQVLLYIYVFYQAKLYSDALLHIVYVFLQLYGWYYWLYGNRGDEAKQPPVTSLGGRATAVWATGVLVGSGLWGYYMATTTDASFAYADAFTTVASLAAQWLMTRKKLESWVFWILVDIVAVVIYHQKGLYTTSLLYSAFLVMAIMGLVAWARDWLRTDKAYDGWLDAREVRPAP